MQLKRATEHIGNPVLKLLTVRSEVRATHQPGGFAGRVCFDSALEQLAGQLKIALACLQHTPRLHPWNMLFTG